MTGQSKEQGLLGVKGWVHTTSGSRGGQYEGPREEGEVGVPWRKVKVGKKVSDGSKEGAKRSGNGSLTQEKRVGSWGSQASSTRNPKFDGGLRKAEVRR